MKRMMYLGALVLGVTVCSQSFGFEILDRMLGGCRKAGSSCCEPGCDAGNGCCGNAGDPGCAATDPGCGAGNGCGKGNGCAEPACDAGNGCCDSGCTAAPGCGRKKHSLFGGLKGLFDGCKRKNTSCTSASCCGAEPACDAGNGCLGGCGAEPGCAAGNGCAEPACDAGNGCCDTGCTAAPRKKHSKGSILGGLLKGLKSKKHCKRDAGCTSSSCCGDACEPGCGADPGCGAGNGCSDPACGAVGVIESTPAIAPTPDASAARKSSSKVAVRTVSTK